MITNEPSVKHLVLSQVLLRPLRYFEEISLKTMPSSWWSAHALKKAAASTNVPWFAEFKRELLSFPAGKHDDQVDALGLIGQLLDQMVPGVGPITPQKSKKVDTGYRPVGLDERPLDWMVF
jgi:hypothetical protein